MTRTFAIADIHGEMGHLQKLMGMLHTHAGLDLSTDTLIQLGDKCDRGKDTYAVFEYFRRLHDTHPDNVIMLLGNHERMMIEAAKAYGTNRDAIDLFFMNGGHKTLESYTKPAGIYQNKYHAILKFRELLEKCGHWKFLLDHLLYIEDESENPFFMSHAPIPLQAYRPYTDFRNDERVLTWSYNDQVPEELWVDPNLENKNRPCIYGHLHGMEYNPRTGLTHVPGVRKYGHAIFLDTGSGCSVDGYLSAIELPSLTVYTSRGEKYVCTERGPSKSPSDVLKRHDS